MKAQCVRAPTAAGGDLTSVLHQLASPSGSVRAAHTASQVAPMVLPLSWLQWWIGGPALHVRRAEYRLPGSATAHLVQLASAPVLGALRRGVLFFSNGPATLVRFRFEKYEGDLQMQNGTIKKLVTDRGFGFIAADDGKEYFFHRSGTEADFDGLRGGELVTFEVEASPKGPRAGRVRIA